MSYIAELHSAHRERRARFAALREPPSRPGARIIPIAENGRQVSLRPAPPAPVPPIPPEVLPKVVNGRVRASVILRLVTREFQIALADITSSSQLPCFVRPRHAAAWLLRSCGYSFPEISRILGRRNHTAALFAVRKVEKRMAADPEFAARMGKLRGYILGETHAE